MNPNNKSNHTDFHSGKRMFIKGGIKKDRDLDSFDFNISRDHIETDKWLDSNDWSNKKRLKFSNGTIKKHLKKYEKITVRRLYKNVDERFIDEPTLFKKYLESILKEVE